MNVTHFLTIWSMKIFVVSTRMCAMNKYQDSLPVLGCTESKYHSKNCKKYRLLKHTRFDDGWIIFYVCIWGFIRTKFSQFDIQVLNIVICDTFQLVGSYKVLTGYEDGHNGPSHKKIWKSQKTELRGLIRTPTKCQFIPKSETKLVQKKFGIRIELDKLYFRHISREQLIHAFIH